ncbi:hypothetical protein BpHYR1_050813 [Brachionus plicatilis]|uniref:Uncharacterized protein n=1 Tax=Brachionus plicatilis TaxID=10195 RepID=A0A3M7T7Q2_BRAPC|nr:hypothetical protein BpHYR1_050813 [Brachionus plicatilis]
MFAEHFLLFFMIISVWALYRISAQIKTICVQYYYGSLSIVVVVDSNVAGYLNRFIFIALFQMELKWIK